MKKIILTILFALAILSSCQFAFAQTVCVSQEVADNCNRAFDEVVALREAVEKFKTERGASDALIKGFNELIEIKNRTISANEDLVKVLQNIIRIQNEIIKTLEGRINKPKSTLQKIFSVIEKLFLIVAGVGIGRGL